MDRRSLLKATSVAIAAVAAGSELSTPVFAQSVFLGGFEHKTQSTEGACNEDICSRFIRNYKRSNFYEQIHNSAFQNS